MSRCDYKFYKRLKFGGKDMMVQIDESLFKGKCDYNRGCLWCGDIRPNEESENIVIIPKKYNNTVSEKNYDTWFLDFVAKIMIFWNEIYSS